MTTTRVRRLLAATVVAAVLAYGLSGHGLQQVSHEGMAGAALGLCLLFVMALAVAVPGGPEPNEAAVAAEPVPPYAGLPPGTPFDGRARASPRVLQRFRN